MDDGTVKETYGGLRHAEPRRGPVDRDEVVQELDMQIQSGRSSQFNRTFLNELQTNADIDIADVWEKVETHFAEKNQVRMRENPYRRDEHASQHNR